MFFVIDFMLYKSIVYIFITLFKLHCFII